MIKPLCLQKQLHTRAALNEFSVSFICLKLFIILKNRAYFSPIHLLSNNEVQEPQSFM